MLGEGVAEFDFVFPAGVQALDGTDCFKRGNRAVKAGAVELAFGPIG